MKINPAGVRQCLKAFDFRTLFREHLGWDNHQAHLDVLVDGATVRLTAIAEKRGFVAFTCQSIPDRATRLKIDHQITKSAREHFVIYADQPAGQQVWQWVRREPGKPLASRDHRFDASQSGEPLIQRLNQIAVSLDEEETITVVDVAGRARAAFDVDKVTKKFYDRFKAEHACFLKLIKGIKADADLQWYTSLMLNRLMFVYFIQKKGFLDGDSDYLRNRLAMVQQAKGKDKFQSFYRYFLLRLFHDGLGKSPEDRKLDAAIEKLLGRVPYLNGGFFEVHQLEECNPDIDIPDKAFERLFDFFDDFSWHLDERPLRSDKEINPDVVGYIFEKYINQKQMGAYYTKEDITEYISKNILVPFLFDAAQKKCDIAFKPEGALWRLLRDAPDRYIYPAVRHGVIDDTGNVIPLPQDIEVGVKDVANRDAWNKPAADPFALPTETWPEHVARRQRCLDIRERLRRGEVHQIDDLVTLNLDIWQFARDAIVNTEGPELLRAFWHTIERLTVLDPTCGSGAFLFAALRILETLYSDCLERMERFIEDLAATTQKHHPEQYSDFKRVLEQLAKHPNERYFVLKSIIINNLFGVDVMEEAVEICKLRLFLKLVAQVETAGQIEPLPDIDFNIRAGNTLVGYATLDQVRKSQQGKLGFTDKLVNRIEEDAQLVETAFRQFRSQQTAHGGKVTHRDKQALRTRLVKLDTELDRYLAGEYGVNLDKQKDFDAWKASHEPFHWFVEFYGIMAGGGFDVIIGNPPYINAATVAKQYRIRGYTASSCPDIYACFIERSLDVLRANGRCGMITPVSLSFSTDFAAIRAIITSAAANSWYSSFARIPAALFSADVRVRNTIWLAHKAPGATQKTMTTRLHRWFEPARPYLFGQLEYATCTPALWGGTIPKLAPSALAKAFEQHISTATGTIGDSLSSSRSGKHVLYWKKTAYNWLNCCRVLPPSYDAKGKLLADVNYGEMQFLDAESRDIAFVVLNTSLLFLYWCIRGDDLNVPRWVFADFPLDLRRLTAASRRRLLDFVGPLEEGMKAATSFKLNAGKRVGNYNLAKCRDVTCRIDVEVCKLMGLSDLADQLSLLYCQMVKTDFASDESE